MSNIWRLNTSNMGKFAEFQKFFGKHGFDLEATHHDLPEIKGDPLEVIVHKASQMDEKVLVEDTSLDIEGAEVGISVRWLLDHLSLYVGRTAIWKVLMAYRQENKVFVFEGSQKGTIVEAKGKGGFGFDPYFLPDGATQTLAEAKPDIRNARAFAVDALINHKIFAEQPVMKEWSGPWQD